MSSRPIERPGRCALHVLVALAAAFAVPAAAAAGPGDRQPAFAAGGALVVNVDGCTGNLDGNMGYDTALAPDGDLVSLVRLTCGSASRLSLLRVDDTGAPDPGFGSGTGAITSTGGAGHVVVLPAGAGSSHADLTVQPDGRIVVATPRTVGSTTELLVRRYLADGTPDATFGTDGDVATPAGTQVGDLTFQPGPDGGAGRLLLLTADDVRAFRAADGAVDTTFGTNGVVAAGGSVLEVDDARRLVIRPDFLTSTRVLRRLPDGAPDAAFGSSGVATVPSYMALALAPGGKIVTANMDNGLARDVPAVFIARRHNADGSPDTSFGPSGTGEARLTVPGSNNAYRRVFDVLAQPRGHVVVTGHVGHRESLSHNTLTAVGRFTPEGNTDVAFSSDGVVADPIGQSVTFSTGAHYADSPANLLQRGTRLLVAGKSWTRLNESQSSGPSFLALDGSVPTAPVCVDGAVPDITYGVPVTFDLGCADEDGDPLTLEVLTPPDAAKGTLGTIDQANDRVTFTPATGATGTTTFTFRASDGALFSAPATITLTILRPPPFDAEGRVVTDLFGKAASESASDVAVRPGGGYVVAGDTYVTSAPAGAFGERSIGDFLVVQYDEEGRLDPSFGQGGHALVDVGTGDPDNDEVNAVALQSDGKVLVAGGSVVDERLVPALVRLTAGGDPDPTFGGGDGRVTTGYRGEAEAVTVQPDGRILTFGATYVDGEMHLVAARYHADGTPDAGFGDHGWASAPMADDTMTGWAADGLVQPDGKVVVAGTSISSTNVELALVRFTADGDIDTAFGAGGSSLTTDDGGFASGLALAPDGKLVVAGHTARHFSAARYTADGAPDHTFSGDGKQVVPLGPEGHTAADVAVTPHGRIVIGGNYASGAPSPATGWPTTDFALVRLRADGELDRSFGGGDGVSTQTASAVSRDDLGGLALDGSSIVLAGVTDDYGEHQRRFDIALMRLDGTEDTTPPGLAWEDAAGTVRGTTTLAARASDDDRVERVVFAITGAGARELGTDETPDAGGTYSATWDTRTTANGAYAVSATAYDRAGNRVAVTRTLTVANPVDSDGDGRDDSADACPQVAASTADGCPVQASPPVPQPPAQAAPADEGAVLQAPAQQSPTRAPETPAPQSPTKAPETPAQAPAALAAVRTELRAFSDELTKSGLTGLLAPGGVSTAFTATGPGVAQQELLSTGARAARGRLARPVVLAKGRRTFAAAGTAKIVVRPTAAGRKLLRGKRRMWVVVRTTFTAAGAQPVVQERRVTLEAGRRRG